MAGTLLYLRQAPLAAWLAIWAAVMVGRAAAEPAIKLAPGRPGNVFLAAEPVEISVQTGAAAVAWTATDCWGTPSAGTAPVRNGAATIRPLLGRLGYFDLHLSARSAAGEEMSAVDTAFAVIRAPSPRVDSPFGVMTHFAQGWNTDLMPLLARAGITRIRDEQYWDQVEAVRGTYAFPRRFCDYMAAAAANGLRPLLEMTFANPAYDHLPEGPGCAPFSDEGRAGFADYGAALLKQYGTQVAALEVWNEYNGTWCTGPAAADRPAFYASMLKAAYARIKAARPDVTVLGGAAVLAPLPWFEDLFAHGALDAMDGIVIHPYRDQAEGVETDVAALNAAMKAANHGVAKPIWVTECANSHDTEPGRRATARYLARLMTILRSAGVQQIYWYLARDYNEFTTGLLHGENSPLGKYAPTAAYVAYANVIAQLAGATPVRRERDTDARTRVYLFDNAGVETRVAWTVGAPATLIMAAPGPLAVTDLMGETRTTAPVDGAVTLRLDENPVYLRGKVTGVRETGRPDALVADSVADFSGTQGAGGWSYGYFEAGGEYDPKAFQPLVWTRSGYTYRWQAPRAYLFIAADSTHPGSANGKPVWAIRRWQSDAAGPVQVQADLAHGSKGGDGVVAKVFRDGTEIYSTALGGAAAASATCQLTAEMAKGTRLDFALTPGPGADINFDATSFRVQITRPLDAPRP